MIRLNKKQRRFVNVYAKYGGNYALIMQELKIGLRQFENYMAQVEVKEYLSCAMERTRESMISALPHIQQGLLEMYNCDDTDPKIKVMIAREILDRAGLVADRNTNINVNINTSISDRARQLFSEKMTIETTAKPVATQVCDVSDNFSTIEAGQEVAPISCPERETVLHNN